VYETRDDPSGVNQKYLAEKLADVVHEKAYGGLCSDYLSSNYCVEIQAINPYLDAMEVARVIDLGSGQLNISGFELLQKGIDGNRNGRLKYGGGWLTTKYYLQQVQTKVHAVAQCVIYFPGNSDKGFGWFLLQLFENTYVPP
jgi:hypothetical protein